MEVDMSAQSVTMRLKRVSQLRRLCLSLGKTSAKEHKESHPNADQGVNQETAKTVAN